MNRMGVIACCAAGAIGLLAPSAPGRQAPSPLDQLHRLEGSLPEGVQAVVTIRNAAAARRTPAGRAFAALVRESGRLAETERAWRALADTLRWSPEQAFDELLGRCVTIVARRIDHAEPGDWALIGEISRPAEERLRMSLRPAPRAVVGGFTVLAVEDGAFELTIAGAPLGATSAREGQDLAEPVSTFMLAPAGSSELLEEMIVLLVGSSRDPGMPLGTPTVNGSGRPRSTAFAMVRRAWGEGAPEDQTRLLAMTAALEPASPGDAFHVRLLLSAGDVPGAPPAWSDGSARHLERDALLSTVGVLGFSPIREVGRMLGLPDIAQAEGALDPMPGRRMALIVREDKGSLPLPSDEATGSVLADIGQDPTDPTDPLRRTRRPLAITLAVEVPDLEHTIPRTDAFTARLEPVLRGEDDPDPGPAGRVAFDIGLPDHLVRQTPLEGETAETWRSVLGDEPLLRWGYAPSVVRPGGQSTASPASAGWWIIGLEAGAGRAQTVEFARAALAADRPDPGAKRRVSVGVVRPREIEGWLSAMDPALAPRIGALRWIDSARWDTWLAPDGAIEGEITIQMHAPSKVPLR